MRVHRIYLEFWHLTRQTQNFFIWDYFQYIHLQCTIFWFLCEPWSCVSSGGTPTPAGTSMFTMWRICTHMKCEVKMGIWEWGHLWFIIGGAFMTMCEHYGLDGWGSYDQVMCCFFWEYAKKMLVFRRVPFLIIAWPQVSVPLSSWPVAYYREGGPLLVFIWGAQPVGFHSTCTMSIQ